MHESLPYSVWHAGKLVATCGHPKAAAIVAEAYGSQTVVKYEGRPVAQVDVNGQRLDWVRWEKVAV